MYNIIVFHDLNFDTGCVWGGGGGWGLTINVLKRAGIGMALWHLYEYNRYCGKYISFL